MNKVVFKTVHGSHLYGLAHEHSDQDYFTVVDRGDRQGKRKYARQTIVDGVDTMTVDLDTWLRRCAAGVPQYLEAMFSRQAEVDNLPFLRYAYRVGLTQMRETYRRTMVNFVKSEDIKRKRHALRLFLNLQQAERFGWFDPTLANHEVDWVLWAADRYSDETVLDICLSNSGAVSR